MGEAANLALKDQQLAMEWVNRYIEHFHGDKNRVSRTRQPFCVWSVRRPKSLCSRCIFFVWLPLCGLPMYCIVPSLRYKPSLDYKH